MNLRAQNGGSGLGSAPSRCLRMVLLNGAGGTLRCQIVLAFTVLLMATHWVGAQPARKYSTRSKAAISAYEQALEFYQRGQNGEAINALYRAQQADDRFVESYLLLAQLQENRHDFPAAFEANARAIAIDSTVYLKALLDAARTGFYSGKYPECETYAMRYLALPGEREDRRRMAQLILESSRYARWALSHPVDINPEPLGEGVNTRLDEYFPSISGDGLRLSFTRLIDRGGKRQLTPLQEDIYLAKRSSTTAPWETAHDLGAPVTSDQNEGAQSMDSDAKRMYFTRCSGPCRLYYTDRLPNGHWGEPQVLPSPINLKGVSSKQPSISPDGRTLYFASNRKGGYGGYDIWCSTRDESGKWAVPVNLGPNINTFADEQSPFIHFDNHTLYFASNGHPGLGDLDLFVARRSRNDTAWGSPRNLGFPINTPSTDMGLIVSADGHEAYYASNRNASNGLDIYRFTLPDTLSPTPVSYLRGIVEDASNGAPLAARCQLVDLLTGEEIMQPVASDDGLFDVCLPVGRQYALFATFKGYLDQSVHFDLQNVHQAETPQEQHIRLIPIRKGAKLTLNNVFFDTDSDVLQPASHIELDRWVALLKAHPNLKVRVAGHTDNVGDKSYNLDLSKRRAHSVTAYLQSQGIASSRLQSVGYGMEHPVATNDTPSGRAKNRRTECEIVGI